MSPEPYFDGWAPERGKKPSLIPAFLIVASVAAAGGFGLYGLTQLAPKSCGAATEFNENAPAENIARLSAAASGQNMVPFPAINAINRSLSGCK